MGFRAGPDGSAKSRSHRGSNPTNKGTGQHRQRTYVIAYTKETVYYFTFKSLNTSICEMYVWVKATYCQCNDANRDVPRCCSVVAICRKAERKTGRNIEESLQANMATL